MNKTILITGGAGFIGSNFIHYFIKEHPDYEIINLDKLTYAGNLENLKGVDDNPNYHFVKGDIANKELVEYLFQTFEPVYVVNFAAESHVDRSIEGPEVFIKSNVYGAQILLDVAKEFWLKNNMFDSARFLQISTDEVYGSLPLESSEKFTEDSLFKPNSPYSASKAAADLLARAYYITYNMPVLITRSSNNFGPRQYPEKLIPLTIITKKDFVEDGSAPAHVYAYGSYGLGMPVGFSSNFICIFFIRLGVFFWPGLTFARIKDN